MRDLIEGCVNRLGKKSQSQWDLTRPGHWVPKPRHVEPSRNNQNDSVAWGVLQLLHHLSKMVAGGKAYASRSSHGRLSASTAVVRESGAGDTKATCC